MRFNFLNIFYDAFSSLSSISSTWPWSSRMLLLITWRSSDLFLAFYSFITSFLISSSEDLSSRDIVFGLLRTINLKKSLATWLFVYFLDCILFLSLSVIFLLCLRVESFDANLRPRGMMKMNLILTCDVGMTVRWCLWGVSPMWNLLNRRDAPCVITFF